MKTATALQDNEDIDLVRRVAQGDARAFEDLMRRFNARIYRAARSILKDDAEAQEAVQEAYWKAYCKIADFRGEARLSTWLTRITINEALMRLRRNRRHPASMPRRDSLGDAQVASVLQIASPQAGPDQLAWHAELRRLIERRVDELPDAYRSVFVLRAIEDMPACEIAQVLDIPEATVRTRFFRARHLLQQSLAGDIDTCSRDAFSFAGDRCDRIVAAVLERLAQAAAPLAPIRLPAQP